jgi:hypothetical protein
VGPERHGKIVSVDRRFEVQVARVSVVLSCCRFPVESFFYVKDFRITHHDLRHLFATRCIASRIVLWHYEMFHLPFGI